MYIYLTFRVQWSVLALRYVGVVWFDFHGLQLLPNRFMQLIVCRISEAMMKH